MKNMPYRLLKKVMAISLITLGGALNIFAQSQPPTSQSNAPPPVKPCRSKPEYRQFDFWIGEWDVEAGGKPAGTNSVRLILGDCVIFENWKGAGGMTGKSFNIYNAAIGKWQQTWVDSSGNSLEFYGEFKDGAMRLVGEKPGPNGARIINKLTFFPLGGGRVRQLWESSQDQGRTWSAVFDGLYIRKKTADGGSPGATQASAPNAEEQVKAAMRRYEKLVLSMDAEGISAMFTPDGEIVDAGKTVARTPASIRAFLGSFDGKVRVEENVNSIESVTVRGAAAILTGAYQQKALILADKLEIQVQGKFEVEWSRQPDGRWLIRRMSTRSAQ
jgi:ketosteroid isomerase-like protein